MGEKPDNQPPRKLGQIRRVTPKDFQQAVDEGTAKIISSPAHESSYKSGDKLGVGSFESFATAHFGKDFLGRRAISEMEQKCKRAGINVAFDISDIPVKYSLDDIEIARYDEEFENRDRFVVLRPKGMMVDGERRPITLRTLRNLFGNRNPFGKEKLYQDSDWYLSSTIAEEELQEGYSMPTKEVIPNSIHEKAIDQHDTLQIIGDERRTAVEAVWDTIFYYAANGAKLLTDTGDVTSSTTWERDSIVVGQFDTEGLRVDKIHNSLSSPKFGVVAQR